VIPLGEWRLRRETRPHGRLLKRANSCLAMGDPGLPVADALDRVVEFYAGHDRRPLVQVEAGSGAEAAVTAAGWSLLERGEAAFLVAAVAQLARRLPAADGVTLRAVGDHPDHVSAEIGDGRLRWAAGIGVLDGDWLGVHGLVVDPAHRRRGLGTAVLSALVEWAAERGARTVWLHVETDNEAALALYEGLGFSEHHRCRYLTAPTAP